GGHRRGIRVKSIHCLRPGREPAAHNQGGACSNTGRVASAFRGEGFPGRGMPRPGNLNSPPHAFPIWFADKRFEELTCRVAREFSDKIYRTWLLVIGQSFAAE